LPLVFLAGFPIVLCHASADAKMSDISMVLTMNRTIRALSCAFLLFVFAAVSRAQSGEKAQADVIVIVDNSVSIKKEGLDWTCTTTRAFLPASPPAR
jgi:hypothetical protein